MSDPTGGHVAYEGDTKLFEDIGAELPDESPAPPDAPASTDAAPVAAEVPATSEAQRLRDEQGRFAAVTKDETAPPDAAAPPVGAAPAAEPPAPTSPEATAPDLSQYPAFEYKGANGQSVAFKGAIRGSDGVLFGKDSLPILERKLAEADTAHERLSQMGRRIAESEAKIKAANDEKNDVLARLTEIMTDPDKADQWFTDTRGNWEKLVLEARLKLVEQERDQRLTQQNEQASEQEVQALIPRLHTATEQAVQQLAAYPEFQDLSLDADWQRDFKQRMMASHFDRLFTSATADDVSKGLAGQVGEVIFHPEPLLAEMRYHAGFARKELARQKGLAEAQARNAQRVPATGHVPTPGAKPAGTPSAKPKPALKDGMSRQDVDRLVFDTLMD